MEVSDFRAEKDRNGVAQELEEAQLQLQQDQMDKAAMEKTGKTAQHQIGDTKARLDEIQHALHEADAAKRKLIVENCDLLRHAEEAEKTQAQLSKDKASLATQFEDARRLADVETRVNRLSMRLHYGKVITCTCLQERINLLGKMKNLEHDLEVMRDHLEEDYEQKQEIERMLSKALADVSLWKAR